MVMNKINRHRLVILSSRFRAAEYAWQETVTIRLSGEGRNPCKGSWIPGQARNDGFGGEFLNSEAKNDTRMCGLSY